MSAFGLISCPNNIFPFCGIDIKYVVSSYQAQELNRNNGIEGIVLYATSTVFRHHCEMRFQNSKSQTLERSS